MPELSKLPALNLLTHRVLGQCSGCHTVSRTLQITLLLSICASPGMAAITTTILQLCNSGDHIVASSAVYGMCTCSLCAIFRDGHSFEVESEPYELLHLG